MKPMTLYKQMLDTFYKHNLKFPISSLHHPNRVIQNNMIRDHTTYCGYMMCGRMTYYLYPILKKEYNNVKLMDHESGYGDDVDDHVHLLINDKIVVDPTYRQFFRTERWQNEMTNYLYCKMPPIFIGTYSELFKKIDYLMKLDKKQNDVSKYWKDNLKNETERLIKY